MSYFTLTHSTKPQGKSIQNQYTLIDKIIWSTLVPWLLIDSLNGLLINIGLNLPLSQLYKLAILSLVIISLAKKEKSIILLFIVIFYLSWYFLYLSIVGASFGEPLLLFSKFFTLLLLYFYFCDSFRRFPDKAVYYAYRIFSFSMIVFLVNIILGLMGYGIPSYGEGLEDLGVKGFFYAGNELGGVLAVLAPITLYILWKRFRGFKFIISYVILIFCCMVLGTKTGILVGLISGIFVPFVLITRKKRIIFGITFILALSVIIVIIVNSELESIKSIDRWIYFYENDGIGRLIFSGRDTFWDAQKAEFFNASFFEKIWGIGPIEKSIERDHLDTLLIFGYFGLGSAVLFFSFLLIKSFRCIGNNEIVPIVVLSNLLAITISVIAGHIWYSAMANLYIALANSIILVKRKDYLFAKVS